MRINVLAFSLLLLGIIVSSVRATVYYADVKRGAEGYDGKSISEPFPTVQACIDAISVAGDECRIRAGRYHENVQISGKQGTKDQPIVVGAYQEEQPIIDGTVIVNATWARYRGKIFRATINQDISQLFIDNVMMTNARWPNALWSDYTVFNNTYWAKSALNSKRDMMIDNGEKDLAGSGINATGALAVLNIGSFNTYVAIVRSHEVGNQSFTYENNFGSHHFKPKMNQYFLEDKLELLDQAGEWFYDKTNKSLYAWTPDGESPGSKEVRGKNLTYSFTITDCVHVTFEKLTFFATTLRAFSESKTKFIDQIQFNSLNFSFPSYSKRMLGSPHPPHWTKILPSRGRQLKTFKMFNCSFYGTDGVALEYNGVNVTLENNLFERNDWTGANMKKSMGGLGTIAAQGTGHKFVRNTLGYNGATAGYRLGGRGGKHVVELNHFHHQCWGQIQNDGSSVQTQIKAQTNTSFRQNWIHDSPKYALRFDAGEAPNIGRYGTMLMNVAMNTNGLMVKGDYHKVLNNLVLDKYFDLGRIHKGNDCVLCVLRYFPFISDALLINNETIVLRNGAQTANGGKRKRKIYPLAGKQEMYNVIGDVRKQVVDPDNFDFRVLNGSAYIEHSVGPYTYDPKMTKYWIPGRQLYKASTPIPPNNSQTVKANRDALMWLNAYGASNHTVYLGETASSLQYKITIEDEGNVFYLTDPLEMGKTYYWRVDAEISSTEVYQGDLWTFTVNKNFR